MGFRRTISGSVISGCCQMFVQLNFFLTVPILLSTRSETLVEVVQVNSKKFYSCDGEDELP